LPSAARLRRKSDFGRVYAKGRSYATDLVVVYVLPGRRPTTRVGFSVSGKLGNAVVRNRTRRRLREVVRLLLADVNGRYDVVVVAKRKSVEADLADLRAALGGLFRQSGVIGSGRTTMLRREQQSEA